MLNMEVEDDSLKWLKQFDSGFHVNFISENAWECFPTKHLIAEIKQSRKYPMHLIHAFMHLSWCFYVKLYPQCGKHRKRCDPLATPNGKPSFEAWGEYSTWARHLPQVEPCHSVFFGGCHIVQTISAHLFWFLLAGCWSVEIWISFSMLVSMILRKTSFKRCNCSFHIIDDDFTGSFTTAVWINCRITYPRW